jgi:hypothetical protein
MNDKDKIRIIKSALNVIEELHVLLTEEFLQDVSRV